MVVEGVVVVAVGVLVVVVVVVVVVVADTEAGTRRSCCPQGCRSY